MFERSLGDDAVMRPLEPWRAVEFASHMDRARDHIRPWVGASFVASDLAGARAVLRRYADRWAQDEGGIYGIWLGGTLVGGTMFVSFSEPLGVCEIGCWLEPAGEGRGLIGRAVTLMIDWAVDVRGISRVEWVTVSDNARSLNVARRLGMRRDGVLRQALPGPGTRQDTEIWSVLADEWRSRPDRAPAARRPVPEADQAE